MNPALTSPKRGGWKLTRIFEAFPEIEAMIDDLYFQRGAFKAEVRPPYSFISQKVREALQALHVQPCDFPGYEAIRRYCKSLVVTNPKAVIRARYGKQAARNYEKEQVGLNIFEGMPLLSVRQLDFHTWDGHTVLHIVDPNGCDHAVPVSRFSIGVMIDENPGAIHGFSIVFEATPSSDDFLETVASALHAYDEDVEMNVKMTMTPRRDVVIGGVVPELKNNAFTVLRTDNAFAMTCKDSIANTMDVTGCIFQFGVPYAWWGRPKIERFNGIFEQRTGHRLPSTTGSGPGDSRRGNSYEMAFGFDINLNDIVETLAEFTEFHNRSYSGKPTHGQTIENIIKTNLKNPASEMIVNPLPKSGHDDWTNMAYVVSGTVRSSAKNGVAPHINALYCRYTFPDHEKRFDLDKKKVYVIIHRRNANIAIAVVKDTNEYLGYLRPEKRWRIAPVPVIMRKRISKKIKRSGSDSLAGNPVDSYIDELSSRVTNGKIDSKLGLEIASLKQQQERTQSVRDYRDSQSDVSESANQIVRSKSVQILDFSKKSMELPVTPDEHERKISKW